MGGVIFVFKEDAEGEIFWRQKQTEKMDFVTHVATICVYTPYRAGLGARTPTSLRAPEGSRERSPGRRGPLVGSNDQALS